MAEFKNRKKYHRIKENNSKVKDNTFTEISLTKMAKRQLFITVLSIFGVTMLSFGSAFAIFTASSKSADYNVIKVGTLNIDFGEDASNTINLNGQYPVSDAVGLASTPYTFTITNTGTIAADYNIKLEDDVDMITNDSCSGSQLGKNFIKYSLDGTTVNILSSVATTNNVIALGTLKTGESKTYSLRVWIREDATDEVLNKHYHGKITVEGVNEQDKITATLLKNHTNDASVTEYTTATTEQQNKMFVFNHEAGEQQQGWTTEELTDYRYVGADPANYVMFNDELWRIIGVFTVEDENGNKEQRTKIMRAEALTSDLAFDTAGTNRWSTSSLQKILNPGYENETNGSIYWNKGSGTCTGYYYDDSYRRIQATTNCDFTSEGLNETAKTMISPVKWYTAGAIGDYDNTGWWDESPILIKDYYKNERGTTIYNSTNYPREISWIGTVGLMYPSDYGYATGGGSSVTQQYCLNNVTLGLANSTYECSAKRWTPSSTGKDGTWTITYDLYSTESVFALGVFGLESVQDITGDYEPCYATNYKGVSPVVYLNSDVVLSGGTGTQADPFTLK